MRKWRSVWSGASRCAHKINCINKIRECRECRKHCRNAIVTRVHLLRRFSRFQLIQIFNWLPSIRYCEKRQKESRRSNMIKNSNGYSSACVRVGEWIHKWEIHVKRMEIWLHRRKRMKTKKKRKMKWVEIENEYQIFDSVSQSVEKLLCKFMHLPTINETKADREKKEYIYVHC